MTDDSLQLTIAGQTQVTHQEQIIDAVKTAMHRLDLIGLILQWVKTEIPCKRVHL